MAWRDTALATKVFGVDGRAVLPMMVWALHFSWITLYISLAGVALFIIMQRFDISLTALFRGTLRQLSGNVRTPVPRSRYIRRTRRD